MTTGLSLRLPLRGRVVLVGVGNPQRGDDAIGLMVARFMHRFIAAGGPGATLVASLSAGPVPEAYAGVIAALAPDTILLVDAVAMGTPPGSVAVFHLADLDGRSAWEVHRPSLDLCMKYLAQRTGARVLLAGIEAAALDWGTRPSPEARGGARELVRAVQDALNSPAS